MIIFRLFIDNILFRHLHSLMNNVGDSNYARNLNKIFMDYGSGFVKDKNQT